MTIQDLFLQQAEQLCAGGELLPGNLKYLAERLQQSVETQTPLRIKLGLDPTRPDLHLGHAVVLRKLRMFQDLGHTAVLLIGDATALIGDPSGRNQTRPALSPEEVTRNAQTYLDQAGKIIDIHKAEIVRNNDWFQHFRLQELLQLAAKVTVAQLLVRDDFAKRYKVEQPIAMHELLYPLMQGYDSVAIHADVELGGSDQRFNNLMGRELQSAYGSPKQQLVLLLPLLEGTDGVVKMSKSYPEHCINLTDLPEDMFGKLMSVPDTLLPRYQALLAGIKPHHLAEQARLFEQGRLNPRDIKANLAKWLVTQYHGPEAGEAAETAFVSRFRHHVIPDDLPEVILMAHETHPILSLMVTHELAPSNAEARRLIQGGGVRLEGEKLLDPSHCVSAHAGVSQTLQVGKRKYLKLVFE